VAKRSRQDISTSSGFSLPLHLPYFHKLWNKKETIERPTEDVATSGDSLVS
jgi:hypothetical protein